MPNTPDDTKRTLQIRDAGLIKRLWVSMKLVNEVQRILNSKRNPAKTVARIKEVYKENGL
jgi:hypothetical protein